LALVAPDLEPKLSTFWTTSIPSTTLPNTTCLPSSQGVAALRAVGVAAGVGHAQHAGAGVLEVKILVGEFFAVDRLAPGAVASRKIAPLAHEARNDAMESAPFEAKAFFARTQRPKILGRLGHDVRTQLHHDAPQLFAVRRDVEKAPGQLLLRPQRRRAECHRQKGHAANYRGHRLLLVNQKENRRHRAGSRNSSIANERCRARQASPLALVYSVR
jgi:hypothetical protein